MWNIQEDETYGISRKNAQHDNQLNATAAYHTAIRPRVYRGPHSCPGDLSIYEYDAYSGVPDCSLHQNVIIPGETVRNDFEVRKHFCQCLVTSLHFISIF